MGTQLVDRFRIDRKGLENRLTFLGIDRDDVARLAGLLDWARREGPSIVSELYDWQFEFPETRSYFESIAAKRGVSMSAIREHLERTQLAYFLGIFEAAASTGFDLGYFERRLQIGRVHDLIDLPCKWYLGTYARYLDITRAHLRASFAIEVATRAEDSIGRVFNLDIQAVQDAYLLSLFESMGVDLSSYTKRVAPGQDLTEFTGTIKRDVRSAVQHLQQLSNSLGDASDQLRKVAENMQESASSIAASTEELGASLREVAEIASEACNVTSRVVASSESSNSKLTALDASSRQIGEVIAVIRNVAERTNLLALNARIEAARSGEAGRGFAVVAGEVKALAGRTSEATQGISQQITQVQTGVASAVEGVRQFREVSEQVDQIGSRIAAAVEQQSAAVHEVAERAQYGARDAYSTQSSAEHLAKMATELRELMRRFRVDD
jgi:uncharacterized protein YoxC